MSAIVSEWVEDLIRAIERAAENACRYCGRPGHWDRTIGQQICYVCRRKLLLADSVARCECCDDPGRWDATLRRVLCVECRDELTCGRVSPARLYPVPGIGGVSRGRCGPGDDESDAIDACGTTDDVVRAIEDTEQCCDDC